MLHRNYTIKYRTPHAHTTQAIKKTLTLCLTLCLTVVLIGTPLTQSRALEPTLELVETQQVETQQQDNNRLQTQDSEKQHYIAIQNLRTKVSTTFYDLTSTDSTSRIFYVDLISSFIPNEEYTAQNIFYSQSTQSTQSSTYPYANLITLTSSERYTIYSVLAGEVGSCSYRDKLLVAQCFYDGLVYNKCTPKQLAKSQYDGYKDFNKFKEECIECNVTYYEDIIKAVEEVFDNGNFPCEEFILYFYSYHGFYSSWHETQRFIEQTDAHRYFAQWGEIEI